MREKVKSLVGPCFALESKKVPDAQCHRLMGVEPVLIRIVVVSNEIKGGVKHVHGKRVVEFRDGSPPGWPLLWAQVEDCARCAVPVGGLRRISDRNELASAAVGGPKHVHTKRVVEFRDGSPPGWPLLWAQVEDCARCAVPVGGGGFDEFFIATNWRVLQLKGRSTYTQTEWSNFAMVGLLAGPYWPLLWARVTASAVTAVFIAHWCQDPNPDFRP
jgi:hypothetical protein